MAKSTPNAPDPSPIRPGAGGHRFGPELQCSECGCMWDEHQAHPKPCCDAAGDTVQLAPGDEDPAEEPHRS